MKLYLYDNATKDYIGEFDTAWVKPVVPGTLIIYENKKYIVVDATQIEEKVYNVNVNPV